MQDGSIVMSVMSCCTVVFRKMFLCGRFGVQCSVTPAGGEELEQFVNSV